jgi:hypothetical protein
MSLWLRFLVCLVVLGAGSASAQTRDRATTSGLALGVGLGHPSGGLGGHAQYHLQLPSERWRISAHAGVGVIGYIMFDGEREGAVGVAGGIMTAFGRRHRLVMDVLAAPFQASGRTGEPIELYYGVGALLGYEWMAPYGLFVRTTLGVAYCPRRGGGEFSPAIELVSLGYKFW